MTNRISSDTFFIAAAVVVVAVTGYIQYKKSRGGVRLPTARQVDLVQMTWTSVQGLGFQAVGVLLFETLFEQQPGALALFPKFSKLPNMHDSPIFKAHVLGVVTTVDTAIGMLNDLPALVPVLQALGKSHIKYGVKPPHYDLVGTAFLTTLEKGLGGAYTPEVAEAYTVVYGLVAATMMDGLY
jgi:nitric oxide dioxygenase